MSSKSVEISGRWLSGSETAVLETLRELKKNAVQKGTFKVTIRARVLGEAIGYCKKQVLRALDRLGERGLISRKSNHRTSRSGKIYRLADTITVHGSRPCLISRIAHTLKSAVCLARQAVERGGGDIFVPVSPPEEKRVERPPVFDGAGALRSYVAGKNEAADRAKFAQVLKNPFSKWHGRTFSDWLAYARRVDASVAG